MIKPPWRDKVKGNFQYKGRNLTARTLRVTTGHNNIAYSSTTTKLSPILFGSTTTKLQTSQKANTPNYYTNTFQMRIGLHDELKKYELSMSLQSRQCHANSDPIGPHGSLNPRKLHTTDISIKQ